MLNDAFNTLLKLTERTVTYDRDGSAQKTITVSMSNYFRNMAAEEEVIIEGREFVISYSVFSPTGLTMPKRGDILTDAVLGVNIVSEVREMFGLKGEILGFRVRTS